MCVCVCVCVCCSKNDRTEAVADGHWLTWTLTCRQTTQVGFPGRITHVRINHPETSFRYCSTKILSHYCVLTELDGCSSSLNWSCEYFHTSCTVIVVIPGGQTWEDREVRPGRVCKWKLTLNKWNETSLRSETPKLAKSGEKYQLEKVGHKGGVSVFVIRRLRWDVLDKIGT